MSFTTAITRLSYNGDGVSVNFPVPWLFYANTDLLVILGGATQALGVLYNVTGAGLGSGTVTFVTAPPIGVGNIQIILNDPLTQTANFVDGTAFPAATLNQVNDRAVQISSRLYDLITRSLRAPDGDAAPAMLLPSAANRANLALVFDGSGNPGLGVIPTVAFTQAIWDAYLAGTTHIYPRSADEIAAAVTPVNYLYGTSPHDIRRYGAVMDGTTDDSAAWAQLALVIGQGGSGYVPPLPTMIKTGVTIIAPAFQRVKLEGYGSTIFTMNAIYPITVTGGFMGGLSIMGFECSNTVLSGAGPSLECISAINFLGCQNCYAIDCWLNQSSTNLPSSGYSLVIMQPSNPADDNTGAFWNKVIRCGTRQATGTPANYAKFGVLLVGACNDSEIAQCNFVAVNTGVGLLNQTAGGATGTLANAVNIHHNAFEGVGTCWSVNAQNVAGKQITGLVVADNRAESVTTQFGLLQGLAIDSAVPTQLARNYLLPSVAAYITQSNVAALQVTVNTDDPSLTPGWLTGVNTSKRSRGPFVFYNDASTGGNYDAIHAIVQTSGGGISLFNSAGTEVGALNYNGTNSELVIAGTRVVGPQIVGYGTPTGGSKQVSFAAGSITLPNLAAAVAQLIIDLKAHGLLGT